MRILEPESDRPHYPHHELAIFPTLAYAFTLEDTIDAGPILRRISELRSASTALTDEPDSAPWQFEWMSSTNLQTEPALAPLLSAATVCAESVLRKEGWEFESLEVTECWANVSSPGGSHRLHSHPNSLLSGVWFAAVPPGSGQLEFRDPRPSGWLRLDRQTTTAANAQVIGVDPQDGLLVVFPSWLPHSVATNRGNGERISVAFNLMPTGRIGFQQRHSRADVSQSQRTDSCGIAPRDTGGAGENERLTRVDAVPFEINSHPSKTVGGAVRRDAGRRDWLSSYGVG